jgi:uncharacterized protein (DUF1800 family)
MSLSRDQAAGVAANRFGYGIRPDEPMPADPRAWLLEQFSRYDPRPPAIAAVGSGTPLLHEYRAAKLDKKRLRQQMATDAGARPPAGPAAMGLAATPSADVDAKGKLRTDAMVAVKHGERDRYRSAVNARAAVALTGPAPFAERLVAFWSNHFAVSADKAELQILAPDFENDAIRPHVFGRFTDLLLAAERHPAMLLYLDQNRSTGPNSPAGLRIGADPDKKRGLNENLGREAMELHTLGARSGYTQADVTEFARALTGWSVSGLEPGSPGPLAFAFHPNVHEPGARTILGRRYAQPGEAQAEAALVDFAAAPATARYLAFKLARHFVADDPPSALVDRMAAAFIHGDGDLPTVYRTLVEAPEAWVPAAAKFKTPWDWTLSTLRGLGRRDLGTVDVAPLLTQLGQTIWKPGQPIGFDDTAGSWAAPDALMRRVEAAQRFAAAVGPEVDARRLAPLLLPGTLSPATAAELGRAESGATALALLLVSPEFQRR